MTAPKARWGALPWSVMQRTDIQMSAKVLVAAIAMYEDRTKGTGCWASVKRLAEDVGLKERQVRKLLRALCEKHILTSERRVHQTTIYRMHPALGCTPAHPDTALESTPGVQPSAVAPCTGVPPIRTRKRTSKRERVGTLIREPLQKASQATRTQCRVTRNWSHAGEAKTVNSVFLGMLNEDSVIYTEKCAVALTPGRRNERSNWVLF